MIVWGTLLLCTDRILAMYQIVWLSRVLPLLMAMAVEILVLHINQGSFVSLHSSLLLRI
jgi:hypothetical protein